MLTGYERDGETGLDFAQARYYARGHGRFSSADPLYLKENRLRDPQQINLYVYVRNNPLTLIDPTRLEFKFTGKDKNKFTDDINNREGAQFKVKLNKDGIVEVVKKDKVDANKLTKSEREFFDAITDKNNRAVLNGIGQDAGIDFGGFKGNGTNDIDTADMTLLRKEDKSLAGHVIGHEMMDANASAKAGSNDFTAMHDEAGKTFSEAVPSNAQRLLGEESATVLSGAIVDYSIIRNGKTTGIRVSYRFTNKVSEERDDPRLPPGHITKVEVIRNR